MVCRHCGTEIYEHNKDHFGRCLARTAARNEMATRFAGVLLADAMRADGGNYSEERIADHAYDLADVMLKRSET